MVNAILCEAKYNVDGWADGAMDLGGQKRRNTDGQRLVG